MTGGRTGEDVVIEARRLGKVYGAGAGRTVAVRDVDLTVHRGERHVLMGLSGSGKSTILRMLNRLIEPTSGQVSVLGRDIARLSSGELRDLRNRHIAMVFQGFGLLPHRSVRDNAAFGLRIRGVPRKEQRERADEALAAVGLEGRGDASVAELSGGMQQRVGLARALAAGAAILLMDEPFSALDPLIRRDMQDLVVRLADGLGATVVFVSHDLNEAMRIGDTITLLHDGRVAQSGTALDFLLRPADDFVVRFTADVNRTVALRVGEIMTAGTTSGLAGAVPQEATLAEAVGHFRQASAAPLAVVDAGGHPVGMVSFADLVTALGGVAPAGDEGRAA